MSTTILPWPVVRRGARDHPVRTLQHLLRARGQSVTVDGDFGPATEAAVRAFQGSHGLGVDGIVGNQTWSALIVQVRRGDTGEAVRGVQEEFQFRNLSGDPTKGVQIDGMMVNSFQDNVQTYFNDQMFEEMNYQTGAITAETSGAGVRLNMIPKDGGNAYKGLRTTAAWQDGYFAKPSLRAEVEFWLSA